MLLQSGSAWCRTAPIPFTEFARETRRLAWRERARNVPSQGRRRARNIAAPPLRRLSARARPAPPTPVPPAPTRAAGRERGDAHCACNWGRANGGGGGGNFLQLNRPTATFIGLSSSLVAVLVCYLPSSPEAASTQMLSVLNLAFSTRIRHLFFHFRFVLSISPAICLERPKILFQF